MGSTEVYNNYEEAITKMRRLTAADAPFKIEFRKKDGSRRIIHNALLRPQPLTKADSNSKYKIQYFDKDNESFGSCYIPLILSLNDIKIVL